MILYLTFLLMFLALTAISIYLRVMHRGNRLVYWASLLILCGGLLGLQLLLERGWIPYAVTQGIDAAYIDASIFSIAILNVAINTIPYCCVLIFYLIYNGFFNHQKWMPLALSIPVWVTLFIQTDLSENKMNSGFVAAWGLVYLLISVWLASRSVAKGNNRRERFMHGLIAFIFIIPMSLVNMYHFSNNHISDQLIKVIPYICVISLVIITLLYVRDAFLGVKRKTMQTVNIGTGIIHHSLKNSIGKIKLNALNIRKNLQLGKYSEAENHIDNLLKTHEAMMETMTQVSHAVSDRVSLQKVKEDIAEVLEEVLASIEAYPEVRINKQYGPALLNMDRKLIAECLQNICNNAVEAMKEKGELRVQLVTGKRRLLLSISDTGPGMDSIQVQNVFEPFYSTKHRSGKHFGLGMYHVKKVLELHKGKVEIKSAPNKGTTISLIFKNAG